MEKQNPQTIEETDCEFYDYAFELEKKWRESLPRFSAGELLRIFPEAVGFIPDKLAELADEQKAIIDFIKQKLVLIKKSSADSFSQWFWREWVKVAAGDELLRAGDNIARLKRLLMAGDGKKIKGEITEEQIRQALAVPIETIVNQQLKKSGSKLVGLCPIHNEKSPSFFVYLESNSFYCYGCGAGGNVINFLRSLHGYSFKEAVKYLIEK